MKNTIITVLAFLIGLLLFWNTSLRSRLSNSGTITTPTVENTPTASPNATTPTPAAQAAIGTNSASPSPTQTKADIIHELIEDEHTLKQQITDAAEPAIAQQIAETRSELVVLQNQLKEYQSAQSSVQKTASMRMHLQQSLAAQTIAHLQARERALERQERVAQRTLYELSLNATYTDQPNQDAQIQNSIQKTEDEIAAIDSNLENLNEQSYNDTAALGNEAINSQNNFQIMKSSTESQIAFLKEQLVNLNQAKTDAQKTMKALRNELLDVQKKLKAAQQAK